MSKAKDVFDDRLDWFEIRRHARVSLRVLDRVSSHKSFRIRPEESASFEYFLNALNLDLGSEPHDRKKARDIQTISEPVRFENCEAVLHRLINGIPPTRQDRLLLEQFLLRIESHFSHKIRRKPILDFMSGRRISR